MVTYATSHNGHNAQVNLNAPGFSGAFDFVDMARMADLWSYYVGGGVIDPDPTKFNDDGYPLTTPLSPNGDPGITTIVFIPTQAERPGDWVLDWDGSGTIIAPSGQTGGALSGLNGFYRFTPTTDSVTYGILTQGTPPITRLRLQHYDDYSAGRLASGQYFTQQFLDKCSQFGAIRFLNYIPANTDGSTNWNTRRSLTYCNWYAADMRPSRYCAFTGIAGNTYNVTAPAGGFTLQDGEQVQVRWPQSMPSPSDPNAPIFLKVGSTAAKQMITGKGNILGTNSPMWGLPGWVRNQAFFYSALLNCFVMQENSTQGIDSGAPVEVCLDLCKQIGAHPHFVVGVNTTDDYDNGLINYVKANSPSWMKPIFEGPNETWNPGNGVNQRHMALTYQFVRNGGTFSTTKVKTARSVNAVGASVLGIDYLDLTMTASNPFPIGAYVVASGFATGGIGGLDFNPMWVAAVNVGSNPNKISVFRNRHDQSGSYSGSSGTLTTHDQDVNGWYGRRVSKLGQNASAIYAADRTKYEVGLGVQTATGYSGVPIDSNDRAECFGYQIEAGSSSVAAYKWATTLMLANYYNSGDTNQQPELVAAQAYHVSTNPTTRANLLATFIDNIGGSPAPYNIPYVQACAVNWKTWALGFSTPIRRIAFYEGGYSPDYWNTYGGFYDVNNFTNPNWGYAGTLFNVTNISRAVFPIITISGYWFAGGNIQVVSGNNPTAVGSMLSIDNIQTGMTQINCVSFNLTFTNGSATIASSGIADNKLRAGQCVIIQNRNNVFTSVSARVGGMPGNFIEGKPYWVLSSGLSATTLQLSATKGGAAIVCGTVPLDNSWVGQAGYMVTAVSGTSVTIDFDNQAFTAWNVADNTVLGAATTAQKCRATNYFILTQLNNFRWDSKRVFTTPLKPTGLQGWQKQQWQDLQSLSDGNISVVRPSLYLLSAGLPSSQIWAALDNIYETPDPPQWLGLLEWNSSTPTSVGAAVFTYSLKGQ
jgi:hypothetical protein